MPRLACLLVPLFALAARLRAEPELNGQAVVVCDGNGSAARLVGASRPARQAGLAAGMTLAQARAILPELIARGRDPDAERSAHQALLEVAWAMSPRLEDAAPDLVYADVAGMERLFPGASGEHDLGSAAMRAGEHLGLYLRVGIAATKLAARVAAETPPAPRVVAAGDEAAFLAPLPLASLGLERRLLETLGRWGVTTVGDLARLPADRVASRLGPAGAAAHLAARGVDARPLVPHHPPPTVDEGLELEWAVVTMEPLLYAVRQSLERAGRRLEAHDLAAAFVELELTLEPEGADRRSVRLPAPSREPDSLVALLRLELEARPPAAPVTAFRVILHPDRPRRGQLTLFGAPELHPDQLATTLARLAARLGPDRVGSPRTVDGHLPERCDAVPFAPPPPPPLRRDPARGRGLLTVRTLRPPVPLEVITDDAPNSQLRLVSVASSGDARPRIQGLVRVAAGPWSLEEGWWSDAPVAREYWDVELSGGGLYRLYRERTSGAWFADGMYD